MSSKLLGWILIIVGVLVLTLMRSFGSSGWIIDILGVIAFLAGINFVFLKKSK